ncbi:uncharacterized protein LOC116342931 [Contarinia nasturtii]|uniref:uncharacterized protein LOC116342931 n=1 Tax=Contarinia nasturtii TaxID=265458 RepID=UPI0012D49737|nr:uncharacterized protein LOC116342931 [Contarinia nasturtii]
MDQTSSLSFEVSIFLRNLRAYANQTNLQIDRKTSGMLSDTLKCVGDLLANSTVVNSAHGSNEMDFLFDLDERCFELRRNIVCRLCIETLPITKEDFEAHTRKVSHVLLTRDNYMPPIQHQSEVQTIPTSSAQVTLSPPANEIWKPEIGRMAFQDKSKNIYGGRQIIGPGKDCSNQSMADMKISKMDSAGPSEVQRRHEFVQQTMEKYDQTKEEQRKKEESTGFLLDEGWRGVRVLESSASDSFDDFNYDSLHLIEVNGLPWSATRKEINNFFVNVNFLNGLNGIHFITHQISAKGGRALIQLSSMRDLQTAYTFNSTQFDGYYIEVKPGNNEFFRDLVRKQLIPSKDKIVFIDGLPAKYKEEDVRKLFPGLGVGRLHLTNEPGPSGKFGAFVKFQNIDDIECAVKRNDNKNNIRVYRSTNERMIKCFKNGCKYPSDQSSLIQHSNGSSAKSIQTCEYLRIIGLPILFNKEAVLNMFPGLEIDRDDGIQIQRDKKNRTALVEFKNPSEIDMALTINPSEFGPYVKIEKAKKDDFDMMKEENRFV